MLPQLVQDLLHLECGRQSLDKHRGPDASLLDAKLAGGEAEGVVPEPSFEMVLHLGKVEVGTGAAFDELGGVVVEVETEVEEGGRHGLAIDQETGLVEVPSTRTMGQLWYPKSGPGSSPDEEGRRVLAEFVRLALDLKVNLASMV